MSELSEKCMYIGSADPLHDAHNKVMIPGNKIKFGYNAMQQLRATVSN